MPRRKFRPATPMLITACSPLPEAPPKPKSDAPLPSVPVRESTPWPGTGKVSGNPFEERNWLLPQNYLASENKNENMTGITSPRPPIKEELKTNEQSLEKCRWGPNCPFCKSQEKEKEEDKNQQQLKASPQSKLQKPQERQPKTRA